MRFSFALVTHSRAALSGLRESLLSWLLQQLRVAFRRLLIQADSHLPEHLLPAAVPDVQQLPPPLPKSSDASLELQDAVQRHAPARAESRSYVQLGEAALMCLRHLLEWPGEGLARGSALLQQLHGCMLALHARRLLLPNPIPAEQLLTCYRLHLGQLEQLGSHLLSRLASPVADALVSALHL